jgi:uncharacterized protein (TIGR00661 family)
VRILYGVQATGNGHISRSRAMAEAFSQYPSIRVDWLFSGRPRHQLFDMECFGSYQWREGLTFHARAGKIRKGATLLGIKPLRLYQDIRGLDLGGYDRVISDFEPVTAWSARRQQVPVIGIGHQYAFEHDIPRAGESFIARKLLQWYAPVSLSVGLHWSDCGSPVLPPIIQRACDADYLDPFKVLVYLPFEDPGQICQSLRALWPYSFFVYHPQLTTADCGNIRTRPLSASGFQADLATCAAVVCNAGFELVSEAMVQGKRILVKPVAGQMEQSSSGAALLRLGYASVTQFIDRNTVSHWLARDEARASLHYPDVAAELAHWISRGCSESLQGLAQRLWSQCSSVPCSGLPVSDSSRVRAA